MWIYFVVFQWQIFFVIISRNRSWKQNKYTTLQLRKNTVYDQYECAFERGLLYLYFALYSPLMVL